MGVAAAPALVAGISCRDHHWTSLVTTIPERPDMGRAGGHMPPHCRVVWCLLICTSQHKQSSNLKQKMPCNLCFMSKSTAHTAGAQSHQRVSPISPPGRAAHESTPSGAATAEETFECFSQLSSSQLGNAQWPAALMMRCHHSCGSVISSSHNIWGSTLRTEDRCGDCLEAHVSTLASWAVTGG